MRLMTLILATLFLVPAAVGAQSSSAEGDIARTPWGHPDLHGVWTWRTATPLERPARYAGQAALTAAEATAFAEEFDARFEANPPLNSELNLELWLDHGTTLTEDHRTSDDSNCLRCQATS